MDLAEYSLSFNREELKDIKSVQKEALEMRERYKVCLLYHYFEFNFSMHNLRNGSHFDLPIDHLFYSNSHRNALSWFGI